MAIATVIAVKPPSGSADGSVIARLPFLRGKCV
jgi:hypothetical protein